MKIKKLYSLMVSFCLIALLTGCSRIAPNKVFSCDDLPGKTIGVLAGTTGADYAVALQDEPAEGYPAAKVIKYDNGADAVEELKNGTLDCIIIDSEPARQFVLQNEELQVLPDTVLEEQYAISVAKENTTLLIELNSALSELKEDGTIDNIILNYTTDTESYKYTSPDNVSQNNGKLIMVTQQDFAPYEWKNESGELVGIDIDIFYALCDKLGYEPVIRQINFEDIFEAVINGEADIGMASITVTEARMEVVDFTDIYDRGVQVIITRKN